MAVGSVVGGTAGAGETIAASTAAALSAELLDTGLASVTWALRRRGKWIDAARDLMPVIAASVPFYGPVVAMLVLAYRDISPWTLPLFFAPALAAQRYFLMYQEQRRAEWGPSKRQRSTSRSEPLILPKVSSPRSTLEIGIRQVTRPRSLSMHEISLRGWCLSEACQNLAHLCGLVHDIGKIGLPAGLLEKPGALTLDERRQMKRHSVVGERILANVDYYSEIAQWFVTITNGSTGRATQTD